MASASGKTLKSQPVPLAKHPAFAPIIICWCAALAGLCTIILAYALFASPVIAGGLGVLNSFAGAGGGWHAARLAGANVPTLRDWSGFGTMRRLPASIGLDESINALKAKLTSRTADEDNDDWHRDQAILSAHELDGDSFDAPIDDQAQDEPLDLNEFAMGDAEEQSDSNSHAYSLHTVDENTQVVPLKDRALDDLSLPQMVERVAMGLSEKRSEAAQRANGSSASAAGHNAGDAAGHSNAELAAALRNLDLLASWPAFVPVKDPEPVFDMKQARETEIALRDALEKLQKLSGAA